MGNEFFLYISLKAALYNIYKIMNFDSPKILRQFKFNHDCKKIRTVKNSDASEILLGLKSGLVITSDLTFQASLLPNFQTLD